MKPDLPWLDQEPPATRRDCRPLVAAAIVSSTITLTLLALAVEELLKWL